MSHASGRPRGSRWTWPLRCHAYDLGRAAPGLPGEALAPARALEWTCWIGGCYTRRPGQRVTGDLERLARGLRGYAELIVAKGEGAQVAMATTRDGARVEAACEAVTGLSLDSDVGLDPAPMLAVFDAARAAYVWQSSSSSTAAWPKWHQIVPFASGVAPPTKPAWQARFAHVIGWLEGVARMPGPRATEPPADASPGAAGFVARHGRGLDPCTDGLVQMSFLPARRAVDHDAPVVVHRDGMALDLDAFLAATGYDAARARAVWEAEHARAVKPATNSSASEDLVPVAAPMGDGPPLVRAFAAAGWLGRWSGGAWTAVCPWWRAHGDAVTRPGASEWSARIFVSPRALWWCPHGSCARRRQSDVRATLPAARAQARRAPAPPRELAPVVQGTPAAQRLGEDDGCGAFGPAGAAGGARVDQVQP